jgi:hypothetical protein
LIADGTTASLRARSTVPAQAAGSRVSRDRFSGQLDSPANPRVRSSMCGTGGYKAAAKSGLDKCSSQR